MTTEIFCQTHGRALVGYDLLEQVQEACGMERREAHDSIHAMLDDLVQDDAGVILDRVPVRPELEVANPHSLDRDTWLVVSDDTARTVLAALTA